jgi:hypothetical protein
VAFEVLRADKANDAILVFDAAAIPHFSTETEAVQGFMHLVRYREAT